MFRITLMVICLSFVLAPNVVAHESDLRGGVFIAHHASELQFSTVPPSGGWCAAYEPYAIGDASEQINRIDFSEPEIPVCWFVLAAWNEEKEFCGSEFGLGVYEPYLFGFYDYHPCFPPGGGLEIPHAQWPEPETGVALATTGTPWAGNFVPLYFFGGYAYSGSGPGRIPISVNTNYSNPADYFVGFANCINPPEPYTAICLGALGINMEGLYCEPSTPVPVAVCCIISDCQILTEEECMSLGGEWFQELISCAPNPCDPVRACCGAFGWCTLVTEEECVSTGGSWLPEILDCEPNPCFFEGACCHGPERDKCALVNYEGCQDLGGAWYPVWESCEPNPCGPEYACCTNSGECILLTQDQCDYIGGVWLIYQTCTPPSPCGPRAVCCYFSTCVIYTFEECEYLGGTWHEEWESCDPNPCIPSPIHETSWGKLKAIYR